MKTRGLDGVEGIVILPYKSDNVYPDNPASYALDSDPDTYSQCANIVGAWWAIDFGESILLNDVNILKDAHLTYGYDIEIADDKDFTQNKTVIVSTTTGNQHDIWDTRDFGVVNTRYLRCIMTISGGYMAINEFQYNVQDYTPAARAYQSSNFYGDNPATLAIDGNTGTYNLCVNTVGSWWAIDFGEATALNTLTLNKQYAMASYNIETADDRDFTSNVQTVYSTSTGGAIDNLTQADFGAISPRYLRVISTAAAYCSFKEFSWT